ncbi:hypothetical protein [Paraburkholderia fungorum]|uniref:hypothetical protein n=1 Tax=Paraburkholderia fungorum TaxID=134537 RepID=UPI0038BD5509
MKTKSLLLMAAACASFCSPFMARAQNSQALKPGQIAPADIVEQVQNQNPVKIGSVSVRTLPPSSTRAQSGGSEQSTLVLRSTDNLIGVSANELVVIYKEPKAVQLKVGEWLKDATVKTYEDHGLVVIRLKRFADIQPLQLRLAELFPGARFDLPVTYFRNEAR